MLETLEICVFGLQECQKNVPGRFFHAPGTPRGPSRVATPILKDPPGCQKGPPGAPRDPGGPRAPLDHPCEFRPCTVIFENLRFSSFTHISNVFSMCFDYHSCFTNFHLSHFTHISNAFSTIYKQHNISETPPLDAREPLWDPSRASEFKKCMGARVAHTAGTEAQN